MGRNRALPTSCTQYVEFLTMRGSLILRLVDITLLLLLSLMAASTIRLGPVEPPVTGMLEDRGRIVGPLRILIREDGTLYHPDTGATSLESVLSQGTGPVEFVADRGAPARILAGGSRASRLAGRQATFIVKRIDS